MSVTSTACSRVLKVHAGNLSRGLGLHSATLSSSNTGYVLEAGAHDPKPVLHLGHFCAGGTGRMRTPQPSIETSWVYALRVVLDMCLVGHPWCTQACRSHLYAGQSAITMWIPGPCHRSCRSISCISQGRGLAPTSPSNFLQVMLDQFTQLLLLCPPMGSSKGYPPPIGPMMTSLHFLLRLCLLWVSQPIRVAPAQMPFCACAMHLDGFTPSFISLSASEGKTTPVY